MALGNNNQWIDDIRYIISKYRDIYIFKNESILITGATGLIGSALVELLIRFNEDGCGRIDIYAAGRSEEGVKDRFGSYADKDYFHYLKYDALKEIENFPGKMDYIVHCASNAFPEAIKKEPVETLEANTTGTLRLIKYSKEAGCKRVVFVSSSEVYGRKDSNRPFCEDDYGFVDLLNARNSYAVGKRAGETLCYSYNEEYGVDIVIVRPGHIYGPTASKKDNRVSSSFAYNAAKGENIVMKSQGTQIRSYVYCLDCASAILFVMIKGVPGNAYNISNPSSIITIKEMADCLAEAGRVEVVIEAPTDEEKKAFNPMDNSSLNSSKLQALGWEGIFDANTGLSHTVSILKSII